MKQNALGIVADGFTRLIRSPWYRQKRATIEAQVRLKHADELSATTEYWQKVVIEEKVAREIKLQLDVIGSNYCLWLSR